MNELKCKNCKHKKSNRIFNLITCKATDTILPNKQELLRKCPYLLKNKTEMNNTLKTYQDKIIQLNKLQEEIITMSKEINIDIERWIYDRTKQYGTYVELHKEDGHIQVNKTNTFNMDLINDFMNYMGYVEVTNFHHTQINYKINTMED